jgi:hypothetical protein
MNLFGKKYSAKQLHERIGNIQQLGGTRRVILDDGNSKGVSAIDINTGAGLCFTVLPDRGLDISRATYKGINLVHLTASGETHPAYYNAIGLGWLRSFYGGLVVTCGLANFGPPIKDGAEEVGLHGRHANIPAKQVQDKSGWKGEKYHIEVAGIVEDAVIFGNKLRMTRTITTELGSKTITIHDRVENFGFKPSPFTILYHINPGFPLLDAKNELFVSTSKTESRDDISKKGIKEWNKFSDPIPGYIEQVFIHKMKACQDGKACAALINRELGDGLGLLVKFDPKELPYLNEWKNMAQGDYVMGIEPANAPVFSRVELREKGLLQTLQPGEIRDITVEISILDSAKEIDKCIKECSI